MGNKWKEGGLGSAPYFPRREYLNAEKINHYTGTQRT